MKNKHCDDALADALNQDFGKVIVIGTLPGGITYFRTSATSCVEVMEVLAGVVSLLADAAAIEEQNMASVN